MPRYRTERHAGKSPTEQDLSCVRLARLEQPWHENANLGLVHLGLQERLCNARAEQYCTPPSVGFPALDG